MKKKFSDEEFATIVAESLSIRECLGKLELIPAGGNYKTFHSKVKKLCLSTSHFIGMAHRKGSTIPVIKKQPLQDILIINSTYTSSHRLKLRLIEEGMLDNKCSNPKCGLSIWIGNPISLHLDHINGCNTDNRLDNLRLLCPNCHSQTDTYCGKNK